MKLVLRISRYNPETDSRPHDQDFSIDMEPTDRILDALIRIKDLQDGSLSFRKSCAHGVCGSDAMIINGKERLACKTLVRDVATEENAVVTLQPLSYMPVQRDLMVDQRDFFAKYRAVSPFLINEEKAPEKERIQSVEQRAGFDDATACILCGSCYSSCPVLRDNPRFIGPAALVQAARFLLDSRDKGFAQRMQALDAPDGAWACENHFNCTRVCPREIKVTKNINAIKRMITKSREGSA
ncbi:MAG: succinate dehydrogenase iron-sulfur subunit [Spirochaetia bacterium]|jgi:succinate dehydrogenase / fumarate reductase iron-sulfur subunit